MSNNSVKICLAQMEVQPGRPQVNTAKMLDMIFMAKKRNDDIIVFPEMAIPGYMLGDIWERTAFLKECENCGEEIRDASDGITVVYGNVAMDWNKKNEDGRVRKYNACFVAEDGEWRIANHSEDFFIKTLQPNYREFNDNRYFYDYRKYIQDRNREHISRDYDYLPITLNCGIKIGCILCEDSWDTDYSLSPIDELATYGVINGKIDLFINISCSPFTAGKNNKRNRVFSDKAKKHQIPMIYVNCVGMQDIGKTVYTFDGESCVYDKRGDIIECFEPFEEGIKTIDFDLENDVKVFTDEKIGAKSKSPEYIAKDDIGKLYQAIKYGTTKFMERLGIDKVVIGASGGIDSALSAAIFSEILPKENILLVNMPSKYNSDTTKDLAKELTENIGCNYAITSIEQSVELTREQIKEQEIIAKSNDKDYINDILDSFMIENVQARDRSSRVLAAWAAGFRGVFTCNANKSEMTVGYTTMYGDLGGFLAPLADLWKTQVYEMANWFNENVKPVIPQGSINIVPSAELSYNQDVDKNKGDPLNYKYHDLLFKSWVERWDRATPEDILEWAYHGVLEEELRWDFSESIVEHVFEGNYQAFIYDLERWWDCYQGLAVAKRIQSPPVLAVSCRAFGFDHREAQIGITYTEMYQELKRELTKC
jgi:NAD+ synthase (glutamine-hydrolysing)